ncbi:MAG: hypothetical protein KBS59_07870, partial [Clostridiales bacterium]|nr:hypothetical protein [Clostridiales bacterium]
MDKKGKGRPSSLIGKAGSVIASRQTALFIICTVLAAALCVRLFYLQIIKNGYYEEKVIEQIVYQTSISAPRGNITDRNGTVLATSYKTERVYLSPCDIKNEDERVKVCAYLSELLDINYDTVYKKSKKTAQRDVTVAASINEDTADKIRTFIVDESVSHFLHLSEQNSRVYPYSDLCSSVLGFCGTDGGLYGLEYTYNGILSGVSGKIVSAKRVDGQDMPYRYEKYIDAENGANLVTTIDYYIQTALEKYLREAAEEAGCESRACGIAMDPKTGEIYGMAVYPSYDLNDPYTVSDYYADALEAIAEAFGTDSSEYLSAYRKYQLEQWNNKCVSETYEPGSTSKIFTTSIALEENLSNPDEKFFCGGSYVVSGWTIRCHKAGGHGALSFAEGLQMSCNPVMMRLSQRMGAETFYKYFSAFGLTEKTGVDIPGEAETIIKAEKDLTELDLAVYSFGQRYNVTTLSQITAVCAVANGGTLVTPHLMKQITDDDGNVLYEYENAEVRQVISEETASTICQILADGVSGSGGARNAYVEGYSVAAKTGTSEKGTVGNKRIVSTVAFAPSDDAKICVIMMIDEPTKGLIYGSQLVAPYISKFLGDVLPYLGVEPKSNAEEEKVTLKNYRGLSLDAAKAMLDEAGVKYEI